MNKNLENAIRIVKRGGVIIFPTDTTFVIGCRMDKKSSVERLFEIRRRSHEKAVLVLVDSIGMGQEYLKPIPKDVREQLMEKYWPGGLTIVLRCIKEKIPTLVRGGGETLGIRMPSHNTILKLIKRVGVPILGPSANFSGQKTPFLMSDLNPNLVRKVDFVLSGRCKIKQPSTVLDVTKKPWRVIRAGAVKIYE